jgi:hypothetical protein
MYLPFHNSHGFHVFNPAVLILSFTFKNVFSPGGPAGLPNTSCPLFSHCIPIQPSIPIHHTTSPPQTPQNPKTKENSLRAGRTHIDRQSPLVPNPLINQRIIMLQITPHSLSRQCRPNSILMQPTRLTRPSHEIRRENGEFLFEF